MNLFMDWMLEKFSTCFTIFFGFRNILFFLYIVVVCQKKAHFFSFLHDHGGVSVQGFSSISIIHCFLVCNKPVKHLKSQNPSSLSSETSQTVSSLNWVFFLLPMTSMSA